MVKGCRASHVMPRLTRGEDGQAANPGRNEYGQASGLTGLGSGGVAIQFSHLLLERPHHNIYTLSGKTWSLYPLGFANVHIPIPSRES